MPRERDEYEIEDFGTRMAKQSHGGKGLEVPQGLSLFKAKKTGSITLDLVPFLVTEQHERFREDLRNSRPGRWYPERTYHTHRNIGVNGETFCCLAMNFGLPCPVCEARAELKKSPHKDDSDRAYDLKPKDRQLWLVYDNDDTDRGVQLWEEAVWNFGRHLIKYIEGARKEDRDSYKAFFHPSKGFTMRITATEVAIGAKEGKKGGNNTEFTVHQFYTRSRPLPDHIINHGYDLDAMPKALDYKTLKDLYHGVADAGDVEKPDDPPRRDQRPPTRAEAPSRNGHDERDEQPPPTRTARQPAAAPARQQQWDDEPAPKPVNRTNPAPARGADPEPPADEPITCATNDVVSFEYRGDRLEGTVIRIDSTKQLAFVDVESYPKPFTVPMEDITVERADTTFDLKNPPPEDPKPAKKKAAAPPPDDEPETPLARPTRTAAPAPTTKAAKANAWDDDDGSDDGCGASAVAPKKPNRK